MKQKQPHAVSSIVQETATRNSATIMYDQIWHNQVLKDIETVHTLASDSSNIKAKNLKLMAILSSKVSVRWHEQSGKGNSDLQNRAKNVMRSMVNFWKPIERDERIRRKVAERQGRLKAHMVEPEMDQEVLQVSRAVSTTSSRGNIAEDHPEFASTGRNETRRQGQEDETPLLWQWCSLRRVSTEIRLVEHTGKGKGRHSRQISFIWPGRTCTSRVTDDTDEFMFREWLTKNHRREVSNSWPRAVHQARDESTD